MSMCIVSAALKFVLVDLEMILRWLLPSRRASDESTFREGRSPFRILRHARIIAEGFTTVLLLPMKNLPAAKYLEEVGTGGPSANRFAGKWVTHTVHEIAFIAPCVTHCQ